MENGSVIGIRRVEVARLDMKVAFIGAGKMGGALLERLLDAGSVSKTDVLACDLNENRLNELRERLHIDVSRDNKRGAKFGDLVVVAVMPKQVRGVLEEIRSEISESKVVMSVAALVSTASIEEALAKEVEVARVMPNIPSLTGSGFNLVCYGKNMKEEGKDRLKHVLSAWGEYREVREEDIETYTVISAMGPTYFLPYIDTLVRFGTDNGLAEKEARDAACLTMKGTAETAARTSIPVDDLKNMIGSQPLKDKEPVLRLMLREALDKALEDLRAMRAKLT
jgi:pyrroline-5-carboxylate reductase